ncbi:MAG: hypothetical protein QMB11_03480 [Nonlabens sp.]|jgi:hypothetical protein|uniref:hypothetical protein n=1 Tax=Nonlabens sp. TaxID=1888209 RepID=UPI0035A63A51
MKNLVIVAVLVLSSAFAKAQGEKIARELKGYIDAETSDVVIEVKDKERKTHYVKSAISLMSILMKWLVLDKMVDAMRVQN